MILNCEACGKRYMIKEGVIKNSPKKVRCTSCGHTWTAYPEVSTLRESFEISRVEKVPIESKDNKLIILAVTLGIAALGSSLLLARFEIVKHVPASKSLYDAINVSTKAPGEGLKFSEIRAVTGSENDNQQIHVSGTITNATKAAIHVPPIEINIMGKCDQESTKDIILGYIGMGPQKINGACVIKSWTLPLKENKILAGEKVQFDNTAKLPEDATSVIVKF